MSNFVCKSTFCVINNPEYEITYKHNEKGELVKDDNGQPVILEQIPTEYHGFTPQQICDDVLNKWISDGENHTGAVLYCESALGLKHLHCVFESKSTFRPLVVLKRLFPKIHIEVTKGTKKDVEDYINKVGKFEEKGEKIVAKSQIGEIVGCQGKRTDLTPPDKLHELIYDLGKTPSEILDEFPNAYKQEGILNKMYYRKRYRETPIERDVNVSWLCGATGTGKSYKYVELCEDYGEENVYRVCDYKAPFDNYNGQDVLFIEEYRGAFPLPVFLILLDKYKSDVHARYTNALSLWTKVYITSPCTPYEIYTQYKDTSNGYDNLSQLYRRINSIVYCSKIETPRRVYYFRSTYPCELRGTAEDYRARFDDDLHFYKTMIYNGQADILSDCIYIKNKAIE